MFCILLSVLAIVSLSDIGGFYSTVLANLDEDSAISDTSQIKETFGQYGCTCMPYDQCKNKKVVATFADLVERTNPCVNHMDVCCVIKSPANQDTIQTPEERIGCGIRQPEGTGFRIRGSSSEARFGEFPWMVALLKEVISQGQRVNVYQCGGALIHPLVVLTAAHCVTRRRRVHKIRAGDWDSRTIKELLPHQDVMVKKVVVHPRFQPALLLNDVALLFLQTPVLLDEHINVVCLPHPDFNYTGSSCFASGWGKDEFGQSGKYQNRLQKIDLEMVDRSKCQQSLRRTGLGPFFKLDDSFVCAGGQLDKDTCTGDGGSPLVCPIPGMRERYAQVGIVSWGIGCGEKDTPGVYANVGAFRKWIDEQLFRHGLQTPYYNY